MKKTYIAPSTDIELTGLSQLLCESPLEIFDDDTPAQDMGEGGSGLVKMWDSVEEW